METYEKYLNKEYYTNLLLYLNKNNNNNFNEMLNKCIEENTVINNIIESDTVTITENVSESINLMSDDIYKKPWNKLNIIHKKIKIKEFVNSLNTDQNEKLKLIKKFIKLLDTKKITKKNDVNYDEDIGVITSIPILKFKNNKYIIKI